MDTLFIISLITLLLLILLRISTWRARTGPLNSNTCPLTFRKKGVPETPIKLEEPTPIKPEEPTPIKPEEPPPIPKATIDKPIFSNAETQQIKTTAQSTLEGIYADLNAIWKVSLASSGTMPLDNPFLGANEWSLNTRRRYFSAENLLSQRPLILAMHSKNFVQTLIAEDTPQNRQVWKTLLYLIKDNRDSIWMFAATRETKWFDEYNQGCRPNWMAPLVPAVGCKFPAANHPHEFYRALDGRIKRNIFVDSFKRKHYMNNIKENLYFPSRWENHGARPADWPRALQWPSDPSACAPCVNGKYPICKRCKQSMGPGSNCRCIPEQIIHTPLVEITQYTDGRNQLTRGVRALSPISQGNLIGEFIGELIPVGQEARAPFGDEKYYVNWMPQSRLDSNGNLTGKYRKNVWPIATLIAGRDGNWTRFIRHQVGANVARKLIVVGGRMRIALYASKNIEFGEEITMNYECMKKVKGQSRSWRGAAKSFKKRLSTIPEDNEEERV